MIAGGCQESRTERNREATFYGASSPPVAVFAAAVALAKRNLNRRAAALGRRPRLFRLIRSRRLPAALPTGETLLSLTFKRSGSKLCLRVKRLPIAKNRRSQGPQSANTAGGLPGGSFNIENSGGIWYPLSGEMTIFPGKKGWKWKRTWPSSAPVICSCR